MLISNILSHLMNKLCFLVLSMLKYVVVNFEGNTCVDIEVIDESGCFYLTTLEFVMFEGHFMCRSKGEGPTK